MHAISIFTGPRATLAAALGRQRRDRSGAVCLEESEQLYREKYLDWLPADMVVVREFDPSEVMRMKALLGPNRRRPSPGATLVLACGA